MADETGNFYAGHADIGYGTEVLVGQGDSPESFVALQDVIEVDLGGFENEIIDKTHLRSPGRAREKLVGLADYENITIRCNYQPNPTGGHKLAGGDGFSSTHNMPALQISGAEATFMVLLGSGDVQEQIDIIGTVSGMTRPTAGVDGKLEITYTVTPLRDYRS
jgi:hypothetical protein